MTKPSHSSSSTGTGIPTRRQRSASSTPSGSGGGGDKTKANGASAAGTTTGGATTSDAAAGGGGAGSSSVATSRPRRLRGRGLPLMTKKPSVAASALNNQDDNNNESDATASETEDHSTTPTKHQRGGGGGGGAPSSSSTKGHVGGSSSSSKLPSRHHHHRAAAAADGKSQTPSTPKGSSSSSAGAAAGYMLTASNKVGMLYKVKLIVNGDVFNPFSKMTPGSSSSHHLGGSSSLRKRTLRGSTTTTTTSESAAPLISTTTTSNNEILVESIPTPPGSKKITKKVPSAAAGVVPLGQDGNLFQCCVCGEFGDVVCCDGCPNVYHQTCLDVNDPSRRALDNDEDPWYCPSCRGGNKGGYNNKSNNNKELKTTRSRQLGIQKKSSPKSSKKIKGKLGASSGGLSSPRGGGGGEDDRGEGAISNEDHNEIDDDDASPVAVTSSKDGDDATTTISKKKKDKKKLPISSTSSNLNDDGVDEGAAAISHYNDAEEDNGDDVASPAITSSSAASATTPTSISGNKRKVSSSANVKTEESNQDQELEMETDNATPEKVDSSASPSAAVAVSDKKKNDDPKLSSLTSSKKKKKRKRNLLDEVRDSMTPEDAMLHDEEGDGEGGDEKRRRTRSASTASIDDVILGGADDNKSKQIADAEKVVSMDTTEPSRPPSSKKSKSGKAVLPKSSGSSGFVVPTPKRKKKKKKEGEGENLKTPPPSSAKKGQKSSKGGHNNNSEEDPPIVAKKDKSSKKKIRSMLPKSSRGDSPMPAASPSNDDVDASPSSMGASSPPLTDSAKKSKKKDKKDKKKKKKNKVSDIPPEDDDDGPPPGVGDSDSDDGAGILGALMRGAAGSGPAKATPAFFFFLGESRPKVERYLTRKHRFFTRLPKGPERNALIAKEAASWWVKLSPSESRRYINMSMREFEQRVIEWKEEKNIKEMLMESDQNMDGEGGTELSVEDELLTQKNHDRLFLGTTVGFKPFKPEPDESHNRVLLELLQDMRFHPVPMMVAKRTESEYGQMDFDRITIPFFDVHGPVSTSVGDECLGCARGWTHFCNVLKRRIPAVEHRAKLQPPLSSLVATRVGLGMRPKPQEVPPPEEKPKSSSSTTSSTTEDEKKKKKQKEASMQLFEEREMEASQATRHLPWVPWDSMKEPSERADDIVQFIEEATSMKVAEPPRPGPDRQTPPPPPPPEDVKKTMMPRAILPTRGKKKQPPPEVDIGLDPNEDLTGTVNKCGRCRTIINSDTGCIQCRRAQLVINMSKRPVSKDDGGGHGSKSSSKVDKGPLKVQTYMLGRINMKEGTGEVQSEGDQAIATGIIRQRWNPYVVLPPHTLDAPTPRKRKRESNDDESVDDDGDESLMICQEVPKEHSPSATTENPGQSTAAATTAGDAMNVDPPPAPVTEEGSDESGSRPGSKRIRSARIGAKGASAEPLDDEYRLLLAKRYKEEADELHKKCLNVACCGILLGLMRRDPLLLFASPVTAEGYSTIIKNPIDFEKIRSNVLSGKYVTLGSFVSDARLLCTNALLYNPPGSIYWKTAKELYDVLAVMQKRASNWMGALKDAHACAWRRAPKTRAALGGSSGISAEDADKQKGKGKANSTDDSIVEDPFEELRESWPEGVEMLENSDWLRKSIEADFMRTKENESAYYGALSCRRAAVAAEASLAPYPDISGMYNPIGRRNHVEDEHLRKAIDEKVGQVMGPVELKELPTWREELIVRVMRRAQSRRLEGLIGSVNGCARCDGMRVDTELKMAMTVEANRSGRSRRKHLEKSRVHRSRVELSTGLGSQNTMKRMKESREKAKEADKESRSSRSSKSAAAAAAAAKKKVPTIGDSPPDVAVTVRGSRVHGWGLFADQPFKSGDVVAEYIGEYVSLAITEAREKVYQEQRIQDYQFRLDDQLVIDATMRGGHGRYINHNCSPNCIAKIIPGKAPNENLKRVIIIAQRDIKPREELTYDYQFPLELDLEARIPCNCHSEHCRGFMNWDLPEKGANSRVLRTQKRGANMRDRIRRLGRPLKSDK